MTDEVEADIRTEMIRVLYEARFSDGRIVLQQVCEAHAWPSLVFERVAHRLESEGHMEELTIGRRVEMTMFGVLEAESTYGPALSGAIDNAERRIRVLKHLRSLYESSGPDTFEHIQTLSEVLDLESGLLAVNVDALEYRGHIRTIGGGMMTITTDGVDALVELSSLTALQDDIAAIEQLDPHSRGRAFGPYLQTLLRGHGWSADESIRTNNEEIDLVLRQDREIYLLEAKWWASPIEAPQIREFQSKLQIRPDVRGVFVSMSGYSEGAERVPTEGLSGSVMLFFGPVDIRSLVVFDEDFESLLTAKYEALVVRKQVMWA